MVYYFKHWQSNRPAMEETKAVINSAKVVISLFMSLSPTDLVAEVGLDLTRSPSWPVVLPIATPCDR